MIEIISIIFYTMTACLLVALIILVVSLLLEMTLKGLISSYETMPLLSLLGVVTVFVMWVLSGLALGVYGMFTH